jgi:hypothetical protein
MTIQWIAEVADNSPDSGADVRIAIDAARNVYVAYVVNQALSFAIGTPGQLFVRIGSNGPIATLPYTWTRHQVVPASQWSVNSLFDLAVDSQGIPHICFQGVEQGDHTTFGDLQHGVWNSVSQAFGSMDVLPPNDPSVFIGGLAMAIGPDDSVHIALSDDQHHGLRYATRARGANTFTLTPIDNLRAGGFSNMSIAVGSRGQVGISYFFRPTGNNPQLMYAEKTAGGWVLDTADQGNRQLLESSMGPNSLVIDPNGVPHIAYHSGGLGLRHGTWTAAGRGNWTLGAFGAGESVDTAGVALPATILLDKSNVLHIAYRAQTSVGAAVLRLATRTVSGWAIATVDSTTVDPSVITGVAACLDPSQEPHIACGFTPVLNGTAVLKHTFAIDLIARPPSPHKRKILQRPGG